MQPEDLNQQPQVTLTQAEVEYHRANISRFDTLFHEHQANFQLSTQKIYYLISKEFLHAWRDFSLSQDKSRRLPPPINLDIFQSGTTNLRPDLREGIDFEILPESICKLFQNFNKNGVIIKRRVTEYGTEKRVPIYLKPFLYLTIHIEDLKLIENGKITESDLKLKEVCASDNYTVTDLLDCMSQAEKFKGDEDLRAWRVDKKENVQTLYAYLKKAAKNASYDYHIKGFGKKLPNQTKLGDLMIQQGDFFVVEAKEKYKKWFLQGENDSKCEGCYEFTELKFPCKCEKVNYCTSQCKIKDQRFHIRNCAFAEMEELKKSISMEMTSRSRRGVTGLRNLGNTCFMNSCLQCLSNTVPLTQYFINNCYDSEINRDNPLGSKGKLAKNYAKFIRGMWCSDEQVFSPDSIKGSVSAIAPMFSGYAQHDSQQFFSFLVDGLHEDLNRIGKKPYVESVESNNRPDNVVALESWMAHIKRNQSIITDLMVGQYRSQVTCPDCKKQSVTFDPFLTITLPIPQKNGNTVETFIIYRNFEHKTKQITISYRKAGVEEWTKAISNQIRIQEKYLRIYILSIHDGIFLVGRDPISQILQKMQQERKLLFTFVLTEAEINLTKPIDLCTRISKKGYYSDQQNLWFKFPLLFELKTTTGVKIVERILRFLYNEAYDNSPKRTKIFSGDTQEVYLKKMMQNRPFELYLRYDRRIDTYYNRNQYKFCRDLLIGDNDNLEELLQKVNCLPTECELDARFTKTGLDKFTFQKLKESDNETKSKSRYGYEDSGTPVNIKECFETLKEEEQLQEGNEWYCSNCKAHKKALKAMSIYKAPEIMILHIKRFKQKGSYRKEKNQTKIIFPLKLNMEQYLGDPTPISSYETEATRQEVYVNHKYETEVKRKFPQSTQFELYAVSNHYGGMGGGHYTAYAKNNGRWYDYNDSSVHEVSESAICGSGAYMLFYRRM